MSTNYVEILASAIPERVHWDTPRQNQGQIVEVSYGDFDRAEKDDGSRYMRRHDRSDGETKYYVRGYLSVQIREYWSPNGSPMLPGEVLGTGRAEDGSIIDRSGPCSDEIWAAFDAQNIAKASWYVATVDGVMYRADSTLIHT